MAIAIEAPKPWEAHLTWRSDAECRDLDPNLFFPVGVTGPAVDQIAAAKEICAICPVRELCLEFALLTRQDDGVWGGLGETERRRVRRRRREAARNAA